MFKSFLRKFEPRFSLSDADRDALEQANVHGRFVGPRTDLLSEGDVPDHLHIIRSGLACRCKFLPDGSRVILAFLIPGDVCDLNVPVIGALDHSIVTLTLCEVVRVPHDILGRLTAGYPSLDRILRCAALVDEAILREWLLVVGHRPADKRLAHVFCELLVRFESVGLATANRYELPLTQVDLSDALGLSPVHVNRTLGSLKRRRLVTLEGKQVAIPDVEALKAFAMFDPAYLYLAPDANAPRVA